MHQGPAIDSGDLSHRRAGCCADARGPLRDAVCRWPGGNARDLARAPGRGGTGTIEHSAAPGEEDGILLSLGSQEWVLAVPRAPAAPGAEPLAELARAIRHGTVPAAGTGTAGQLVPVPDMLISPQYGAALHHREGMSLLYCPASEVGEYAAQVISAMFAALGILSPPDPGQGPRIVAVSSLPHEDFQDYPEACHPAAGGTWGPSTVLCVCDELISSSLAADISRLCAAQAAILEMEAAAG